jgi:hypothetical protein
LHEKSVEQLQRDLDEASQRLVPLFVEWHKLQVAYGSTWTVRDGAAAVAAAKASLDAAAERKLRVEHEIHVLERAQGARLGIGRLVIMLHCIGVAAHGMGDAVGK